MPMPGPLAQRGVHARGEPVAVGAGAGSQRTRHLVGRAAGAATVSS